MVYDLIVVGNGLAAQTFLFELFKHLKSDVKKSQNFSVAQIFSEEIAPACSLRSTASVSLNGTEEGISDLGDDLRNSFFLFEDFVKDQGPEGVEAVRQMVTFSNNAEKEKLIRRYKKLNLIKNPLFNFEVLGVELDSYLVSPTTYGNWFNGKISSEKIDQKKNFLKSMTSDPDGSLTCELMNSEKVRAKKVVLCTGAYAKIFSQFYLATEEFHATQTVAGAYLEKTINLSTSSFYITIDRHNLIYRSFDQTLIMGTASRDGAFNISDYAELEDIYKVFCSFVNFSLGSFSSFKTVVGLRHKAQKRRPVARALNDEKTIYMINGFYKNGYSFGHLCAEKIVREIF